MLPFLGGALYALGFPTKPEIHFFLFPIIGIAFLIHAWGIIQRPLQETRLRVQILSTLLFCLSYTLVGYYWIPHTLYEFGELAPPLNYIFGVLFSLIVSPQFYLTILLLFILKHLKNRYAHLFSFIKGINKSLAIAGILTFAEYFTPQQFPAHLGHPWLQLSPFIGMAPVFGASIFSFFSYWIACSGISFLYTQKRDYLLIASFSTFMLANIAFKLDSSPDRSSTVHSNAIRFVQANIGNVMKLSSEAGHVTSIAEVGNRFYSMSTSPSELGRLDLIIWPETAFPHLLHSAQIRSGMHRIPNLIEDILKQADAQLFIGGYDSNPNSPSPTFESEYNAAFLFEPNKEIQAVYHKRKLIPFGEGLPFGRFNAFFSQYIQNISFFAKGEQFKLFRTLNETPFISAICYEILFPSFIREYFNSLDERPHFIVNLTNDSWYGDTAEPFQHLFLAKWRAIEFQTPILRMTNTGITSVIYKDGSESERIGVFEQGILDKRLQTSQGPKTLYQRFGPLLTFLVWVFMMLISYLHTNRKSLF